MVEKIEFDTITPINETVDMSRDRFFSLLANNIQECTNCPVYIFAEERNVNPVCKIPKFTCAEALKYLEEISRFKC